MKKKVIGLSILLLVLLLGLSTTCYANITENQLKNYAIYLGVNKGGKTEQYMIDWLETATWTNFYNPISNYIDNDNYDIFLYSQGTEIYFYYRPTNTTSNLYISDMSNYSVRAPNFNGRRVNTISTSVNNSDNYNSQFVNNLKANSFYTDLPIYSNNSYSSITFSVGTCYPTTDILDGPFQDVPPTYFEFDMNEYSSTQYVNVMFNGTTYNNVPVYYKAADTSQVLIGTLLNTAPVTLKEDFFGLVYWNGSSWVTRDIQERELNIFVYSSPFLSIQSNSDMTEYTYGQQPRFAAKDCFYFYSIDDIDYNRAYALWYLGSSHTIISGDKIDPITFNDYPDYDDNVKSVFNNIDDIDNIAAATEPILQALTDDEQVSGELAGLISGDADDIANRFGYSPIDNPFVAVVVDITESLTDILLGSGDVSLNFGFGGRDYYVSSSKFVLPSNSLTSFIHLCCNAFVLWQLWKYGFKLYEWVNSGRLQNLVNETNGHQYFLF